MPEGAARETGMTRREALAWLAGAAGLGCGLERDHSAWAEEGGERPPLPKLAELVALRNEAAKEIPEPPLLLVRTAQGLAAFPRVCTHRHADLAVDRDGCIYCPNHGSRFGLDGKPLNGPASRPLVWLKTEVDASGAVRVDVQKRVQAGAWAPLPEWAKPKAPARETKP